MALILIADDEANVRQVLKRWIEKSGHEVLELESADAALHNHGEAAGRRGVLRHPNARTRWP